MMRLFIAGFVALVLTVTPVAAGEPDYASIVQTMGCAAPVYLSNDVSPASSFYMTDDAMDQYGRVYPRGLYLGTSNDAPADVTLIILLHETGHCLQHQVLGTELFEALYKRYTQVFELDADRQAADMACQLGLDGSAMLTRTLEWARDRYGYEGDSKHGSWNERVSMSIHAAACQARSAQSPLLGPRT